MTELTQPLAATPKTETKAALRDSAVASHATTFAELVYAHFDWWRALRDDHVPNATKAAYHEALAPLRGAPRRDRQRLLVLARRERRRADAQEARAAVGDADLRVPSRERLGDAELAGHRARAAPLRRARGAREDGAHRRPAAHLHAARDGLGRASAEPRRRAGRRTRTRAKAEAALEQERDALAEAETYYREAANGQAQIVYFVGMAVVAIALSVGRRDLAARSTGRARVAALVAGALGAVVSVIQRINAGKFTARLRRRPAVRLLPRRAAAADRRRVRDRDLVRVHRRSPAPAGRGRRVAERPPARAARRQLPRRLQRALGAGHARSRGAAGRSEARVVTDESATGISRGDLLRLDYDHTLDQLRTLTDVRFKLLALVPTVSGTAIGLLGRPRSAAELLGVGLLGLCATLGHPVLRAAQHAVVRLRDSAREGGRARAPARVRVRGQGAGGLYSERPDRSIHVLGVELGHDRGLALVYGAALAGWSYLVSWGALRALDVARPRAIGGIIGVVVGLVVVAALVRLTVRDPSRPAPSSASPRAPKSLKRRRGARASGERCPPGSSGPGSRARPSGRA